MVETAEPTRNIMPRRLGPPRRLRRRNPVPRPFGPALRQRIEPEVDWTDRRLAEQRRITRREANAEREHNGRQNPNPPARRRLRF